VPQQRLKSPVKGRAASKELRRQQLIKSTIDSIAKRGFADTTLANVADGAGLSRGIVNFHFKSKNILLIETLKHVAEEYRRAWSRALASAGGGSAEALQALLLADFEPAVCNRKKIAVWYAFYAEAKSRPAYLELCGAMDEEHFEACRGLCADLIEEGNYEGLDPTLIARSIAAMTDGFWLDLLIAPQAFSRDTAIGAGQLYLTRVFPDHFPLTAESNTRRRG
jgi:TetR/AcrR family transcriptional repressor of bet genes